MADLASLRELVALMRAEGILYARTGDLELRLEPARPAVAVAQDDVKSSAHDDEPQSLEEELGLDPGPFNALRRPR